MEKMSKNTIYVITQGEYEDTVICGATVDKNQAEYIRRQCENFLHRAYIHEYIDGEFETFFVDGSGENGGSCKSSEYEEQLHVKYYEVVFGLGGAISYCNEFYDLPGKEVKFQKSLDSFHMWYIKASTDEEAVRIAIEKRNKIYKE